MSEDEYSYKSRPPQPDEDTRITPNLRMGGQFQKNSRNITVAAKARYTSFTISRAVIGLAILIGLAYLIYRSVKALFLYFQ